MKTRNSFRVVRIAVLGLALAAPPVVSALDITLPEETATYKPSALPGYALVQRNCLICHSAQYAQSQPPASPRSYWDGAVHKMKKVFRAPLPDSDMPAIVDYLVKTYGAEQDTAAAAPEK